jgi:HEAT repeat protein
LIVVALVLFPGGCGEPRENPDSGKDKPFGGRPLNDVLQELKDTDPKVRLKAVKLLGSVPNKEAVQALAGALEDPDAAVAEQAAVGLRGVGPAASAAVPALVKRLKDPPSEAFREAAVTALGSIGPKAAAAAPLLVEQLRRQGAPVKTRRAAVIALGRLGPGAKTAVQTLIDALADRELEQDAVEALLGMREEARPAIPALSKRMRPEIRSWLEVVRLLADLDPQAARAAIPDLKALAASEPVRDQGIVNFRMSQQRIQEAKNLLKRLDAPQPK